MSAARAGNWRRRALLSLALASSPCAVVDAGAGVWTTGGPYGGDIRALAVDPRNPGTLYAGTAGVGEIFKSTDFGASWTRVQSGLWSVNALAIDPLTTSTLYAGTEIGLRKSIDSGATWVDTGLPDDIRALAVAPTNPTTLYAGDSVGIRRSTDAGATWAPDNLGAFVRALVIDPTNPSTLYAAAGIGVFKSTNSGDTWTAPEIAPGDELGTFPVLALVVDPANPANVYAGTNAGVFKSTDAGRTWTTVGGPVTWSPWAPKGVPPEPVDVYALSIDPTDPGTLCAGTYFGIFKSTDAGRTWAAVYRGLGLAVQVLVANPATPTLYAGASASGVLRSADAGSTWVSANGGLTGQDVHALALHPQAPTTLYAATDGGVYRSIDSGGNWARLGLAYVQALAIAPAAPTTLYAGTDYGVFRSSDAGATWSDARKGLTDHVRALAVDPANPATVYAATADSGVFRSTNSGDSWTVASFGLSDLRVFALAIDPSTPTTLYAGTWFGGVFRSTDSGDHWARASAGLPSESYVRALAIDPATPTTLYAVNQRVFKSTDSGGHWAASSTGPSGASTLVIDPTTPTTLYAGTSFYGFFKSTDAGGSWVAVNRGLPRDYPGPYPHRRVQALALDPTGATTLYAGLDHGSVWRSTPPEADKADLTLSLSASPDPVTGTAPLTYTLSVANAGPDSAGTLSVSQTLPASVAFDEAVGGGWLCGNAGSIVSCTRDSLGAGEASAITVHVRPGPAAAVLVSSATVSAAESDPNPANNSASATTTVNPPAVWIGTRTKTVTADAGGFFVDGAVTYTLTLANTGGGTQADNPGHELVDVLPTTLALVSVSATTGRAVADAASNTVSWDGSLPSGGSVTVTIHATVQPWAALGTSIANLGIVSYDLDGDGTNEATTTTDDLALPGANDPTSFRVVSPAMGFYTLAPCRLVDTREPPGSFGGPALAAGAIRVFPLAGQCGIPPTARAVSVNLTVTQPTTGGNLLLFAARTAAPLASSINFAAAETRAGNAVAPLNGLGELAVRCSQPAGTTHLVLDVNGYFE